MSLISINPATEEIIQHYAEWSPQQLNTVLSKCDQAFSSWKITTLSHRCELLERLGKVLAQNKASLAAMMTQEMGKPIVSSIAEVEKCISLCEYYTEHMEKLLSPRLVKTSLRKSYVSYHALGIIYAIMPWNFPLWQVMRFAVPNLTAGNVGVLKHAPHCIGLALLIEQCFLEAGYPENVFTTLLIDINQSPSVIAHPKVRSVTITGSEAAGKAVASEAGKALKKVVLELGGSDPFIVLEDAPLEQTAETIVKTRFANSGQVCIAPKRIILVETIAEKMRELILHNAQQFHYGDPMNTTTMMGPLARHDLREQVHRQVEAAAQAGARILLGGKKPTGKGYFYPPTVLENIQADSDIYHEEIFGPVIALFTVKDESVAIQLANNTRFGLGATIFTQDLEKGEYIANTQLQAGTCCVNIPVFSDPRLPFGGIYHSGFGRELGDEGVREFLNIKTVHIA